MKFLNYLSEDRYSTMSVEEIRKLLSVNCKPMLDFIKKKKFGFRRNYNKFDNTSENIKLFIPRSNRKALDTPQDLSDAIDKILFKKLKWYPRKEGVFTWPDSFNDMVTRTQMLRGMGVFMPRGDFKVAYATSKWEIRDLFMWLEDMWRIFAGKESSSNPAFSPAFNLGKEWPSINTSQKTQFLHFIESKVKESYTDKFNNISILSGEIMFKCDAYYLIKPQIIKQLMEEKFI